MNPQPVICICGATCSGQHYPYRNQPAAEHRHHVAVVHASRDAARWQMPTPMPMRAPAWARVRLAARMGAGR